MTYVPTLREHLAFVDTDMSRALLALVDGQTLTPPTAGAGSGAGGVGGAGAGSSAAPVTVAGIPVPPPREVSSALPAWSPRTTPAPVPDSFCCYGLVYLMDSW